MNFVKADKTFLVKKKNSCDETNFLHRLLLTNTQVLRLRKVFANNSSANIKLSKTQLHKIGQSGGFLGRFQEHY